MTGLKTLAALAAAPTLAVPVLTQVAHIEVDTAKLVGWVAGSGVALLGLALRTIWNDRDEKIKSTRDTLHALKNTVQAIEFRLKHLEEARPVRKE